MKTPAAFLSFLFLFRRFDGFAHLLSLNLRRANDSELACSSVANLFHRAKRSVSISPALIAASIAQPVQPDDLPIREFTLKSISCADQETDR